MNCPWINKDYCIVLYQVVPQTKLSDPELKDEQAGCEKSLHESGVTLSVLCPKC